MMGIQRQANPGTMPQLGHNELPVGVVADNRSGWQADRILSDAFLHILTDHPKAQFQILHHIIQYYRSRQFGHRKRINRPFGRQWPGISILFMPDCQTSAQRYVRNIRGSNMGKRIQLGHHCQIGRNANWTSPFRFATNDEVSSCIEGGPVKETMEISVRRARQGDETRLLPLYLDFYREDGIAVSEHLVARNLSHMLVDDRAGIWIAEENDNPIGMSSATVTFGVEFGWACELEDLYVVPGQRGKGLSRELLSAAIDWARDHGAKQIILVITPEAEAEQGLSDYYRKLGFTDSGRITMYKAP